MRSCIPDIKIIGVAPDGQWPASNFFDIVHDIQLVSNSTEYKKIIEKIIDRHSIHVLLPISEREIAFYRNNPSIFKTQVLINPMSVIDNCLDKYKTYSWLKSIHVSVPETYLLNDANAKTIQKCIIKPRKSAGSKNLYYVNNIKLYDAIQCIYKEEAEEYVVQREVGSKDSEYTCALWRFNEEFREIILKRKLVGGLTGEAKVEKHSAISKMLKKISNNIKGNFFINVQLRLEDNIPYVFEINPRFSSTVALRHKVGFQDVLWSIKYLNNGAILPYNDCSEGVKMYRLSDELIVENERRICMNNPYIIAEMSGNHNGDIQRAFKLMEEAKKAGANAVKLQTYTADTLTINHDSKEFVMEGGLWDGRTLYELYEQAHTPWEWHESLYNKGKELGITVFSTPFDETAVDLLESLNNPIYKVASFELTHHPLIAYIAKTKKPMIMSTGMASKEEISAAVDVALANGCKDLTLLHCVSEYPAPIENSNLATMVDLKATYPRCRVGLSDHTLGTTVAMAAVALGASVIEKHFTLSRSEGGVDSAFSLEPHELEYLCKTAKEARESIGTVNYHRSSSERKNTMFRRSIYITRDVQKGERFSHDNIKVIRPGYGLPPSYMHDIIGSIAKVDCTFGTPMREEFVENE